MSRSVEEENISRLLKDAWRPLTSQDLEASLARFRERQLPPRPHGRVLTALAAAAFLALIVGVVLRTADDSRPVTASSVQEEAERKLQAALDELVNHLGSDKAEVRQKAEARLLTLGEAALDALDRGVTRQDLELRVRAKKVADEIRRRLKEAKEKPSFEDMEKIDTCSNHFRQLWTLQTVYMSQFGGRMKNMPSDTGPAFWLALTKTVPPLIDGEEVELLVCPGTGQKPREGYTTFRGPKVDVRNLKPEDPVGACEPGSHPAGKINVLLKTGKIRLVGPDDDLYKRALENTVGAAPAEPPKK